MLQNLLYLFFPENNVESFVPVILKIEKYIDSDKIGQIVGSSSCDADR